ncbi:calx-beta domain-containing protein, partial [Chrysochromulina tobinii]
MHVTKAGAIDWAVQAGGTDWTYARSIANDGGGGALVTGYFYGEASFGSTVLTRGDTSADIFVMHVTVAGAIDWAVQAGGSADTRGSGVAYDGRSGGALVTGDFSGKASFGSTSLTSRGSSDAFVMHVTAAGAIDWAIQAGGKLRDSGYGIALVDGRDGVDGFLVSGTFSGEASFGSNTL